MTRRLPLLVLLASVVLAGSGVGGTARGASSRRNTQPLGVSPHGDPAACMACHQPGDEVGGVSGPDDIVTLCRTCHPTADMHPVGMVPSEALKVPAAWPPEAGKVVCSTCHGEPAHEVGISLEHPWLRAGSRAEPRPLCFSCHDAGNYRRQSPHAPRPEDPPPEGGCSACHTSRPEDGAAPADSLLRRKPEEACSLCHEEEHHVGVDEHLGKPLTAAMKNPALPPTPEGAIACYTCHEVHAAPRIDRRAASHAAADLREQLREELSKERPELRWPGEAVAPDGDEANTLLALPVTNDALCRACHGVGG